MKNKKAISLIVLVITIIVLAILAATVIISLSNTNIIEQARSAAFKSDMANYKEAYNLYLTSMYAENPNFDKTQLTEADFATIFNGSDYPAELKLVDGELAYETADENEKKVLQELGMTIVTPEGGDEGEGGTENTEWAYVTDCYLPESIDDVFEYAEELEFSGFDMGVMPSDVYGTPCFDEVNGILYSVNMPEGETELVIPEEINGVKVNGVSGLASYMDRWYSFMPDTLTKVTIPEGVTLYTGAFDTTNKIEVVTTGAIGLNAIQGQILKTDSEITVSKLNTENGGYTYIKEAIPNLKFASNLTGGIYYDNIEIFEVFDGHYQFPVGVSVGGIDILTLTSGSIYVTVEQFEDLESEGSDGGYTLENEYEERYKIIETETGEATGAYVIIGEPG